MIFQIKKLVANHYRVPIRCMMEKTTMRAECVWARRVLVFVLHKGTDLSRRDIQQVCKYHDRSSVKRTFRLVQARMDQDRSTRAQVEHLIERAKRIVDDAAKNG